MSQKSKSKKQFVIGIIILCVLFGIGIAAIVILQNKSSTSGQGTVVRGPELDDPTGDTGSSIIIKDNVGKERIIQVGGAFSFREDCGSIKGKLTPGAKIAYNFLPEFRFCAYDGETDVSDIYIRVID